MEARCQITQWLDYTALFAIPALGDKHTTNHLLKELNSCFSTKSYLVGQNLSLADIALFYAIQNIIGNLTTYDKENYLHLSRWFNHLQQQERIRCKISQYPVSFSTLYLIGWSKGTHL